MTGLVRSIGAMFSRSYQEQPIDNLDRWTDISAYGAGGGSGRYVSEQSALSLPAAYACIDLIGKAGSLLPGHVFERINDGVRDRRLASDHYLYPLIHDMVNPSMPACEWRRIVLSHLMTWGNSYSWIEWKGRYVPKAIWIIPPSAVQVRRDSMTAPIRYFIRDGAGQYVEFPEEDILHIRGLGFDGTIGYSPVTLMRNSFALALASENSASMMHKNGITSRFAIQFDNVLSEPNMEAFKKSFQESYGGLQNQHKAIIMQAGAKLTPISMNPHDAQFLEQWKNQDAKIYQIYGVPPHMVGDTEKSTSWGSGIEAQKDGFVTFTMLPLMKMIETWQGVKLLPVGQRKFFVEYDFKGLMRADTAARSAWYKNMISIGAYSPNRVLRAENEEPYPAGEVYQRPLNTAFVDADGKVVMMTTPPDQQETENETEPPAVA